MNAKKEDFWKTYTLGIELIDPLRDIKHNNFISDEKFHILESIKEILSEDIFPPEFKELFYHKLCAKIVGFDTEKILEEMLHFYPGFHFQEYLCDNWVTKTDKYPISYDDIEMNLLNFSIDKPGVLFTLIINREIPLKSKIWYVYRGEYQEESMIQTNFDFQKLKFYMKKEA